VHGHMLGPEEADLIESDDSDKVRLLHDMLHMPGVALHCACSCVLLSK
jgi:hypothetical protein